MEQKRPTIRKCCCCLSTNCPGNSDILHCPEVCTVPRKKCVQVSGCLGVDNGKNCTAQGSGTGGSGSNA